MGRSQDARPSPRAPHSSTHPTPPAALAHPGHLALASHWPQGHGLGRRRRGGERARGLPKGLTVLGAGDDTGSQRQRETGPAGNGRRGRRRRKHRPGPSAEQHARRRRRRRWWRRRNGRAGRRAAPARRPRAPPRPSLPPAPPIGPTGQEAGAGWEESGGTGAHGRGSLSLSLSQSECFPNSHTQLPLTPCASPGSARLPPRQHVVLLRTGSPLPSRSAASVAARALSWARSPTDHPRDLKVPSA